MILNRGNEEERAGGSGPRSTGRPGRAADSGDRAVSCPVCGEPLLEEDRFCVACGTVVTREEPAPAANLAEEPEAGGKKPGFSRSPAGIVLIVAIVLVIAGGVAAGLLFVLKGGGGESDQGVVVVIDQSINDLKWVKKDLGTLDQRLGSVDFNTLDQVETQAEGVEGVLSELSSSLTDLTANLEGAQTGKLLSWQEECLSSLSQAAGEYGEAVEGIDDLLKLSRDAGEFQSSVDQAVSGFEAAIITQNGAASQYRGGQYAAARSTADKALEQVGQARQNLERASGLEPDADLAGRLANIGNAEKAIKTFQQMCDAMVAADTARESVLAEQFMAETAAVSNDIRFDSVAYIQGAIDGIMSQVAERIQNAAVSLQKAEEIRSENQKAEEK